ncbi:MAG: tetratricopeptide repeat protein, partial [Nitrososphaeria archaeon]
IREENYLNKNLLLGLTGLIIAFLINGIFNFPWRVVPTLILLWVFMSIFSLFENKKTINLNINFHKGFIFLIILTFCFIFSVLQVNSLLANICIKKGQSLFANEKYEEARKYFEKAIFSNPRGTDKIELVLYAGNAYNSLKLIDKAIYYYNEGLKMFPNFIEAHYNIGNVYMNNNLTEKAIEEYQKVLALNPKFTNAINNLANIYFAKNEFEKALELYKKALEIKPDNPDTRFNLSASYFRLKKYDLAYNELKKILEYAPDYGLAKEWIEKMKQLGLVAK